MATYLYKKINAFTTTTGKGNPAACLYLSHNQVLSSQQMQDIAADHKGFVSEVVFCTEEDIGSYHLRYYSSECEIAFCGHGTIACMYELLRSSETLCSLPTLTFRTNKETLTVYNSLAEENAVFIAAPTPTVYDVSVTADSVCSALGLSKESLDTQPPLALIDAGLRTLIVPICSLQATLSLQPDRPSLQQYCLTNNIDIILVYTKETSSESHYARTRVFAPKFGYLEDPATGSGNSAFGYYLLQQGLWDGSVIRLEQNGHKTSYNEILLKKQGERVLFGGCCTTIIDGHYLVN
ncbi:PhzF family phenazine biosynthesis protein [Anaerosporobacter faecicola]|uniref:PhzF family phenazine biosynthesis protein n=1 Tax=Anaerosporobacter faecicola TaxID=2718714 RepID=UPI00143A57D8|nr:PhzF family phenazine biosynthesis protein [Anaerosporobacter faecicola]